MCTPSLWKHNKLFVVYIDLQTASLTVWSAYLITNQEVVGLIPGTSTILKVDYVWNEVPQPHKDHWLPT